MGIGDWGLGIGDWAQSPNPKPPTPIPNPPTPIKIKFLKNILIYNNLNEFEKYKNYLSKNNFNIKFINKNARFK